MVKLGQLRSTNWTVDRRVKRNYKIQDANEMNTKRGPGPVNE